jgi:hypothetical protein
MDQKFSCPECGRQTDYRPQECALLSRYKANGNQAERYLYRLVYCPGCGKRYEAPEVPPSTPKAGLSWGPAGR